MKRFPSSSTGPFRRESWESLQAPAVEDLFRRRQLGSLVGIQGATAAASRGPLTSFDSSLLSAEGVSGPMQILWPH